MLEVEIRTCVSTNIMPYHSRNRVILKQKNKTVL